MDEYIKWAIDVAFGFCLGVGWSHWKLYKRKDVRNDHLSDTEL